MHILYKFGVVLIVVLMVGIAPVLAQSEVELTETYEVPTGGLAFDYPAGWVLEELLPGEAIVLGSSPSALAASESDEAIPAGEVLLVIYGPTILGGLVSDDLSALPLEAALEAVITALDDPETDTRFEAIESAQVAGYPAVTAAFTSEYNHGVAFLVDFDGSYVVMSAKSVLETYPDHAVLSKAIFDTVRYTPSDTADAPPLGDLTGRYTTLSGALALDYPADWVITEKRGVLWLSSSQATLDAYFDPDATEDNADLSGAVTLIVEPGMSALMYPEMAAGSLEHALEVFAATQANSIGELGDIQTMTLAEHPALLAPVKLGFVAVIDFDGEYVVIRAITGFDRYKSHLLTVLDTLAILPPSPVGALTEVYEFPESDLAIHYPADWVVMAHPGGELLLVNNQEMLDALMQGSNVDDEGRITIVRNVVISIREPARAAERYPGISEATSLEQAFDVVASSDERFVLADAESMTIGGQPALVVPGKGGGFRALIDFDGEYVVVGVEDGLGRYQAHTLAILDTLAME